MFITGGVATQAGRISVAGKGTVSQTTYLHLLCGAIILTWVVFSQIAHRCFALSGSDSIYFFLTATFSVSYYFMNSDHIFIFKLKEIVQLDLENMKARLEGVDASNRLFLERELAVLAKQLSDFKTDFKSATASLKIRIQDLEAQNTKVTAVIETNTHESIDLLLILFFL